MKRKIFGFGIIGTGVIAHFHAKAIAAISNAVLIGVYNVNKSKADIFSKEHGGVAYNTVDELVNNPLVDIICICTPSGLHLEPVLKCIAVGKHCLIEKPLEVTMDRCNQIIEAAEKAFVKVGVIYPSRFYAVHQELKWAIAESRFGNLIMGDAYVKWSRSEAYYKLANWRGTWQYDGGGALMNQAIHSVDLLQWYMGPVKTVYAFSANRKHKQIEVEDTSVAVLKFCNGALGNIACTTAAFPGSAKRIEILGTRGTVVIEEDQLIRWQFQDESGSDEAVRRLYATGNRMGGAADPAGINFWGHQQQIENMMLAIESSKPPVIDAMEGRKSVEIVLAIYESAKTGKPVNLSF